MFIFYLFIHDGIKSTEMHSKDWNIWWTTKHIKYIKIRQQRLYAQKYTIYTMKNWLLRRSTTAGTVDFL